MSRLHASFAYLMLCHHGLEKFAWGRCIRLLLRLEWEGWLVHSKLWRYTTVIPSIQHHESIIRLVLSAFTVRFSLLLLSDQKTLVSLAVVVCIQKYSHRLEPLRAASRLLLRCLKIRICSGFPIAAAHENDDFPLESAIESSPCRFEMSRTKASLQTTTAAKNCSQRIHHCVCAGSFCITSSWEIFHVSPLHCFLVLLGADTKLVLMGSLDSPTLLPSVGMSKRKSKEQNEVDAVSSST
jgi:hypothetical protein